MAKITLKEYKKRIVANLYIVKKRRYLKSDKYQTNKAMIFMDLLLGIRYREWNNKLAK